MKLRLGVLAMLLFGLGFAGAAGRKDVWYGADGKPVRAVKASERKVDAWQPKWVKRELADDDPVRHRRYRRTGYGSYYGSGIYAGRTVYFPRYYGRAGYLNYGHGHYRGHGRRGGHRGHYRHGGGYSNRGARHGRGSH